MYLSTENNNTNVSGIYNSICDNLIAVGWELFYTTSATNKTFRSDGEDGLGPYIYLNVFISGSNIYVGYYSHWTTVGLCPLSTNTNSIVSSTDTAYRFYGNKSFLIFGGNNLITNGTTIGGFIYLRAPDRMVKTITNPIVGGTEITITLPNLNQIFLGYKYLILGMFGEGQQEVTVTNINTGTNQITITGCTNSYAAGALFGEHIATPICYSNTSGRYLDSLSYVRNGATLSGEYVLYSGMLGGCGNSYAHNTDFQLEPMVFYTTNRSLGVIDPNVCLYAASTGISLCDMLYANADKSTLVPSFPSSLTSLSLTDTSKNWPVNSLAGKICIFPTGTSMGYSRYIVSNTSDTLTFRVPLPAGIAITTGYGIVDKVWRIISMSFASSGYFAVSEIF